MAEKLSKLIIVSGGKEYKLDGGGGGKPEPNSVGTEEIVDGSVEARDLSEDVKEKTRSTYDPENEGIKLGGL